MVMHLYNLTKTVSVDEALVLEFWQMESITSGSLLPVQ